MLSTAAAVRQRPAVPPADVDPLRRRGVRRGRLEPSEPERRPRSTSSSCAHELQRSASALANISWYDRFDHRTGPRRTRRRRLRSRFGVPRATRDLHVLALALLSRLQATPKPEASGESVLADLREGLRYARSRPDIVGTYVVDLLAMILAFPVVMLPFVAARFHETYALSVLYCGLPAGALVATLTSRWSKKVHRYGRAIVAGGVAVGARHRGLWLLVIALARRSSDWPSPAGRDAVSGIFRKHHVERVDPARRARTDGRHRDDLLLRSAQRPVSSALASWRLGRRCASRSPSGDSPAPVQWGWSRRPSLRSGASTRAVTPTSRRCARCASSTAAPT